MMVFRRDGHDKALHSSSKASQSPQSGGTELLAVHSTIVIRYCEMRKASGADSDLRLHLWLLPLYCGTSTSTVGRRALR